MISSDQFSSTPIDPTDANELIARWKNNKWAKIREAVCDCLTHSRDLPSTIQSTTVQAFGEKIELLDLRGINLEGLSITNADLSYCCFDHANLSSCKINKSFFQYSSFNHADFSKTTWTNVQASPISADEAKFNESNIANTFLMKSYLKNTEWTNASLTKTALSGSNLIGSNLYIPAHTSNDVTDTILDGLHESITKYASWTELKRPPKLTIPIKKTVFDIIRATTIQPTPPIGDTRTTSTINHKKNTIIYFSDLIIDVDSEK